MKNIAAPLNMRDVDIPNQRIMVAAKNRPLPSSFASIAPRAEAQLQQYLITISAKFDEERLMDLAEDLDDPWNETSVDGYGDACERAEINDEMGNVLIFISDSRICSAGGLLAQYRKVYTVEAGSKDTACSCAVEMLQRDMEDQYGLLVGEEEIEALDAADGLEFKIDAMLIEPYCR